MKMHNTLPRELREEIYDHLAGCDHTEKVWGVAERKPNERLLMGMKSFFDAREGDIERLGPSSSAHMWEEEYVGAAMAAEPAEHYYRTTEFQFDGSAICLLSRFLAEDVWIKGLVPRELVRKVRIHIVATPQVAASVQRTLTELIPKLGDITHKEAKIVIRVYTREYKLEDLSLLRDLLESLAALVYHLRGIGYNGLRLEFSTWYGLLQITRFFDKTWEEWQARMDNKWKRDSKALYRQLLGPYDVS
jgi:hypothetical protein